MEVFAMQESELAAKRKWQEYVQSSKKEPKMSLYTDMKKVYFQLYRGKKVIDIHKVMKLTGAHPNGHPKIAIVRADQKEVHCEANHLGDVIFSARRRWSYDKILKEDVRAVGLPVWPNNKTGQMFLKAPVPLIPPRFIPEKMGDDYYILWEVDTWTPEPPIDPYLLRRITDSIFVIVAAWDLTEVERSIMKARLI